MELYYWRGAFKSSLRGQRCEVLEVAPWHCPNVCCAHRLCGTELQLRPANDTSRSRWHVYMEDRPCGCRVSEHVLSLRP